MAMSGTLLGPCVGPPKLPSVRLRGTLAGSTLAAQLGPSFATGALSKVGAAKGVSLPPRGALPLAAPPTLSGCSCGPLAGVALLSWHVWSSANSLPRLPSLLGELGTRMLWESLRAFLRHSGGVLKGRLKAASAAFLEATACELDAAQADRAHDLAWRKLRSLTCRGGAKWKGARSLPGRVGKDGVAATNSQEISGVVLRHFAAIEAAEVCSVEVLADRHGRSRSALACGAWRDISNVCDMVTLRRLFAQSKRGKACGIEGVRDDYCAIALVEMANVHHPLLTKSRSLLPTSAALPLTCGRARGTTPQ